MSDKVSNEESDNNFKRNPTRTISRSNTSIIDALSNEGLLGNVFYQRVIDYEVEKKITHYIKTVNEDIQKKDEQIKELSNKAKTKVNDQSRHDVRSQFGLVKNELEETVKKLRSVTNKYFECKKTLQDRDGEINKLNRQIENLKSENDKESYLIHSQQDQIYLLINELDDNSKIKVLGEKNFELLLKLDIQMNEIKKVKKENEDLKKENELLRIKLDPGFPNNSEIVFNNFKEELAKLLSDSSEKVEANEFQIKNKIQFLLSSNRKDLLTASIEKKNKEFADQINLIKEFIVCNGGNTDIELKEKIKRLERKMERFEKESLTLKRQLKIQQSDNKTYRNAIEIYKKKADDLQVQLDAAVKDKISFENEIEKLQKTMPATIDGTNEKYLNELEKKLNEKVKKINELETEIKNLIQENANLKNPENPPKPGKKITITINKNGNQLEHKIYEN